MTTYETATSLVSGRSGVVVSQRRKVFEMRNQYTLPGEDGEAIGAIEQVGQSPFTFLARLISDLDVSLPVTLDVTSSDGALAMRLHKPWFRFRVTVKDANSYAVTFEDSTADSVRQLALAAALAVDLTVEQKDYGSPLDLIDF